MMPRLLLVEDDPVSCTFMTEALQALPAEVQVAGSMATTLPLNPDHDLWLLDAHLPDGSGQALLARLRARFPDTPALAHTASASPTLHDELLAAGFNDVVVKPVTVGELLARVRHLLPSAPRAAPAMPATPPSPPSAVIWDDETALLALNGQQGHVTALRQLFVAELPQQRDSIMAALQQGDSQVAHQILHQLKASCGFVGALRLKMAVELLDRNPAHPETLSSFVHAVEDTLAIHRQACRDIHFR